MDGRLSSSQQIVKTIVKSPGFAKPTSTVKKILNVTPE
jgi:hypothetical protein